MPEKNQPDYQKSILQSEAEEKSKRMVSSMCPLKMKGNLQEEQSKKHSTKIAVSLIGKEEIEKRLKELKETPDKTFDQHVIAYIDFLGSKERMKKEDSYDSLHLLQILLALVITGRPRRCSRSRRAFPATDPPACATRLLASNPSGRSC